MNHHFSSDPSKHPQRNRECNQSRIGQNKIKLTQNLSKTRLPKLLFHFNYHGLVSQWSIRISKITKCSEGMSSIYAGHLYSTSFPYQPSVIGPGDCPMKLIEVCASQLKRTSKTQSRHIPNRLNSKFNQSYRYFLFQLTLLIQTYKNISQTLGTKKRVIIERQVHTCKSLRKGKEGP